MILYQLWHNLLVNSWRNKYLMEWFFAVIFTLPAIVADILFLPFELIAIIAFNATNYAKNQKEFKKKLKKKLQNRSNDL